MEIGATTAGTTVSQGTSKSALTSDDFMTLLITQLQMQDPFEPMTNEQMLSQVSTIEQMQSSQKLSDTLGRLANQQQFAGASDLVGKYVIGDAVNAVGATGKATGKVVSVQFSASGKMLLELDTGLLMPVENVEAVRIDPLDIAKAKPDLRDFDVNGDYSVDIDDLRKVIEDFTGPGIAADTVQESDIDRDGDVDADDAMLIADYLSAEAEKLARDVNGDNRLNNLDLDLIMDAFTGSNEPTDRPEADLDGDGDVDLGDVAEVLSQLLSDD